MGWVVCLCVCMFWRVVNRIVTCRYIHRKPVCFWKCGLRQQSRNPLVIRLHFTWTLLLQIHPYFYSSFTIYRACKVVSTCVKASTWNAANEDSGMQPMTDLGHTESVQWTVFPLLHCIYSLYFLCCWPWQRWGRGGGVSSQPSSSELAPQTGRSLPLKTLGYL